MDNNLFEILEKEAREGGVENQRATIRATARAHRQVGAFLGVEGGPTPVIASMGSTEWKARFALVEDQVKNIVADACVKELATDENGVYASVLESLRRSCTHCNCSDCTGENCGCCDTCDGKNCYNQSHSNTRSAAEATDGDTYHSERVDLPKANDSGLSEEPSPKMDKGNAGDEWHTSQEPIEVPSVRNKHEVQNLADKADYTKTLDGGGVIKTINADTPLQDEHNVADHTDVFPNRNQAQPVTSNSKWRMV